MGSSSDDFESPVKGSTRMVGCSQSPISVTPISKRSPRKKVEVNMASPTRRITRSSSSPSTPATSISPEKKQIINKLKINKRSADKKKISGTKTEEPETKTSMEVSNNATDSELQKVSPSKTENVGDGKKSAKPNTSTFRSGLKALIDLFKELCAYKLLRDDHDNVMKKTPFGQLYLMFKDQVLNINDVRKPFRLVQNILTAFSKADDAFIIAGEKVHLQVDDMATVFGLPMSGKVQRLYHQPSQNSNFVKRYWPGMNSIPNTLLISSIRTVVTKKENRDVEDFCKMVIMLMVSTIFQCGNGSGITLPIISMIDDLEEIGEIAWARLFYDGLIEQIRKWDEKNPFSVTTCSILLIYFLLEHTTILEEKGTYNSKYPRAAKWSFQNLGKKNLSDITIIKDIKVTKDLVLTAEEIEFLKRPSTCDDKYNQTEEMMLQIAILNDQIMILESAAKVSKEKMLLLEKEKSTLAASLRQAKNNLARKEVDQSKISLLQDTEKIAKGKIWDMKKEIEEANEKYKLLKIENEDLVSRNMILMEENADLINRSALIDELQLEVVSLRYENSVYKDKQSSTRSSSRKRKHTDEVNEDVNNTPKVNSTIKALKEKTRKKKEDPIYAYKSIKKKKTVVASSSNADLLEIDSNGNEILVISPIPRKEGAKLPKAASSPYYKSWSPSERKIILNCFANNTESSIVWENKNIELVLLGLDLKNIMFDEFISERIVNWFAYDLQRSTQTSSSSDQYKAEIFPAQLNAYYLEGKSKYMERELDDKILNFSFKDTEALIFPMIHRKRREDKTGIHWTLLVLDTTDWSWSHYDSNPDSTRRGKTGKSIALKDAIKLQQRVNAALNKHKTMTAEEKLKLDVEVDTLQCPNQGDTVNCGLYICMFMETLFVNKTAPTMITDKEGAKKVKELKLSIPLRILNDNAA